MAQLTNPVSVVKYRTLLQLSRYKNRRTFVNPKDRTTFYNNIGPLGFSNDHSPNFH